MTKAKSTAKASTKNGNRYIAISIEAYQSKGKSGSSAKSKASGKKNSR